jgi:hypothetical protein
MGIDSLLARLQAQTHIVQTLANDQNSVTDATSLKYLTLHEITICNQGVTPVTSVTSKKNNSGCDELPNSLPGVQLNPVLNHIESPHSEFIDVTNVTDVTTAQHSEKSPLHLVVLSPAVDLSNQSNNQQEQINRFTNKGVNKTDAERLVYRLAIRDQELDHRKLCLECRNLLGHQSGNWRCANWKTAGIAIRQRDSQLPADLVVILQNCDGFQSACQ